MRQVLTGLVFLSSTAFAFSAGAQTPTPTQIDGATHEVRLQDVRTRVDEVKEKIRELRNALQAQGRGGPYDPFGAQAQITLRNEIGGAFRLVHARVFVDGVLELVRDDDQLQGLSTIPVFHGPLVAGEHVVRVELRYRGNGALLPYLEAFKFDIASSHVLTTEGPRPVTLTLRAFEKGDATTPFEQRPAFEWSEKIKPSRRD
jgi:hypothetical protein